MIQALGHFKGPAELAFSSATIERLKAELAETNAKLEAAQRRSGGYHR